MKSFKKNFLSMRIRQSRKAIGWNQSELARQARVTSAAISQIEKGGRWPSIPVLKKITDALKVSLADILTENIIRKPQFVHEALNFHSKFSVLEKLSEKQQKLILELANSLLLKQ